MEQQYIGNELDLFARAHRWKAYWSARVAPWLGPRVLDVGAGIGGTAQLFHGREFESYVALEPDPQQAARIAARRDELPSALEVRTGTLQDLPAGERFDAILYIDVLEHIADDAGELAAATRHLLPGGRIVVLAPAHPSLYSPFDAAVGHHRRYTRGSLLAAKPAGLAVERLDYLDSVGYFASLANRWLLRASMPTQGQIRLWDGLMVPLSRWLDPCVRYRAGKSVLASFRNPEQAHG